MDKNQFPRRLCWLALCLIAIEIGISYGTRPSTPIPQVQDTRVEKIVAPHSPEQGEDLNRPTPSM